jgi:hypothetical protein
MPTRAVLPSDWKSRPLADNAEHRPGTLAPVTGVYRLLNVFGAETHTHAHVVRGEPLPGAPMGHGWRLERETEEPTTQQ